MIDELVDELRILGSTNTQTRRLGYIVQICKLLADSYAPNTVLQKRIEGWAEENNSALRKHVSDKGQLGRSARSYGARRYIQLAQKLHLITNISGYLRPTVTGRVLLKLDNKSGQDNPFRLGNKTILLFLFQLLLLDADYLLPTLQLTHSYDKQDQLLEVYQKTLSNRLRVMETEIKSLLLRSEAHERLETIARWTNPVKYLEHIVLPRLHWLLDLELLDWNSFQALRIFEPSAAGAYLINHIPVLDRHLFANRSWCQNILPSVLTQGFGFECTLWHLLDEESQMSLVEEYVDIGFRLFHTEIQYRISAYQLALFMILDLSFEKNIAVGLEDIKQAFKRFAKSGRIHWDFFWSATDNDGYLLLSKQ